MKTSETKKSIVKNIIIYMPGRYFSQFLGVFTSLLIKRFLGPFYTGIWSFLRIVVQYVDYFELGTSLAIYYKIPFYNGRGDAGKVEDVKDNVFTFLLLSSLVASISIIAYALFFSRSLSPEIFFGLLGVAIIVVAEKILAFNVMLLRANKNYGVLSKSVYFDAILNLSLVLLIVSNFKLYGMVVVTIVLPVMNIIFILYHVNYGVKIRLAWSKIISYIRFGFPLYVTGILNTIFDNVDNLIIVGMLGFQQLGVYSIAMMAKNYSRQVSIGFGHVTGPHFMEDYGKHGNVKMLESYVTKGSFAISSFMSIVLGIVFIFSTPLIMTILPSFAAGLTAMKILLITSFFASLVDFPYDYIVAVRRRSVLVLFVCIALILNSSLSYILIKNGLGINGAAIATAASSFFYMLMLFFYGMKGSIRLGGLIKIIFPLIYSSAVVLLLEKYVTCGSSWGCAFIKAPIFILASLVTLAMLEKETGLMNISCGLIKNGLKKVLNIRADR